jgi:toxin ParE1/3/4
VGEKRVIRSAAADSDVEAIIDYYLSAAGTQVALGFVDVLEHALSHLSRHASTGSPKYAVELNLPGLRSWPFGRFPYLVFYFETPRQVQVWRVLHDMLDLPHWLAEDDSR